jgi:hypothetical protein
LSLFHPHASCITERMAGIGWDFVIQDAACAAARFQTSPPPTTTRAKRTPP